MPAIRLVPLTDAHLCAVAAMIEDEDVRRFTLIPVPASPEFPREWVAGYQADREAGTREAFAVVEDDQVVGLALAVRIDREGRTVELGYIVAHWARGRGVAAEALRKLTIWAFEELGALRSELRIDALNTASQRVAERAGYRLEGTLRSHPFKQALRSDLQIWSRLPSDP